jgi:hypothetical protein
MIIEKQVLRNLMVCVPVVIYIIGLTFLVNKKDNDVMQKPVAPAAGFEDARPQVQTLQRENPLIQQRISGAQRVRVPQQIKIPVPGESSEEGVPLRPLVNPEIREF